MKAGLHDLLKDVLKFEVNSAENCMLTLADYVNEDYGVSWDVEAEIQKELEALDANESSNVSGNTQLEMVEEEKKGNIINHAANDFENLMGRLQLQNEKLLQFEQSVFSSERCPNGFSKHMVGEAIFLGVNVESAQEASSQNCSLAMQDLIRPLYCFDQEEICQFNDGCRVKEKLLCCKKNKVRTGRLENVPSVGQSSMLTAKSMKQIQYDRMLQNAEDLKSSLLHSLRLNHGLSSPDMVKFEIDEVGAQDSMPFLGIALISNLQREDNVFSNKWAIGTATRASSNSGLFSMDVKHALTKVLDPSCDNVLQQLLHFDCFFKICLHLLNGYPFLELPVCVMNGSRLYCVQSNMVKGKRPFFVSLDPFGWQVIIVCEVTSTSFLKQLEDRSHVSATIKSDPSGVGNFMTRITDRGVLCILLSTIPQIYKLGVHFLDEASLSSQSIWRSHCFQSLCLNYEHGLLCGESDHGCMDATGKDECFGHVSPGDYRHLDKETKHHLAQDCGQNSKFQLCMLEHAQVCDKHAEDLLKKNMESQTEISAQTERSAHLHRIVRLQATVRGFVARKYHRARLEGEQRKICNLITKVQACWRGWKVRKSDLIEKVSVKTRKRKNIHLSEDECLQSSSQVDYIQLETTTNLRRIITLQSLTRGFLARKHHMAVLQEKRKLFYLITKVQAYWKGWKVRKSDLLEDLYAERKLQEIALVKLQALWRGFRTRTRFQVAVKNCKYDDYDEYEYAAIDENDYFPGKIKFEELDPYTGLCHEENIQDFSNKSNPEACQHIIGLPFLTISEGKAGRKQVESRDDDLEKEETNDLNNLTFLQRNLVNDDNLTNCLGVFSKDDDPACVSREEIIESCDMLHPKSKNITRGKHLHMIDERKIVMAEIAKDWGFKEEKTALQFIRALENTRRQAEAPKPPKSDSQTRLRAFMVRTGRHKGLPTKTIQHANFTPVGKH